MSRIVVAGALFVSTLFSACSNQDNAVQPNGVTMNGPHASHLATPAAIIPIAGDLGAFTNPITASNQGRDNGGPFYDNVSAGDLPPDGPTNCSIGHFVLGIMDPCHYAAGNSNSNSPAVGAVFATGSYWSLQSSPLQPAGFMFSGATTYTVTVVGGYRGGNSEIGWFTIDALGTYHFNPVGAWLDGPGATLTPVTIDPQGANWGIYYTNTFSGHTGGGGCGGTVDHYCTDATAGIPANPVAGTPNQNQFALFTNSTGTQFVVGVEDNQLQLISDGNGLLHDSDYQDYIFTVVPNAVTPSLDLTITKSGPTTANVGQQVTYTVQGTNSGPATALNVQVQDTLPAGATYVTSSDGGTQLNGVVTWPTIASLASGGTTPAYTVTVTYAAAGTYKNNAHVFTTSTETNTNNNHADASTVLTAPPACAADAAVPGLSSINDYLFLFTDGSKDANWQGATKGFFGNVAVDGGAAFRTSGGVPFKGTIFTNGASLGAWQQIVTQNAGQAFGATNSPLVAPLESSLNSAFAAINAMAVTPGYDNRTAISLNGLNTQNGIAETFVINITSGFQVSSQINITGDAGDVFILRWDTDKNAANGYQGQVKFQSGGAIVPKGGLTPASFISVAGDIASSGGGSNPPLPYPQGPGSVTGGGNWNGGGFFTGYWLTTGDPVSHQTSSLSNAIFVGGWYSTTTKFSMTSGTSGVHVSCP